MTKKKYGFREGSRASGDPQIVGEELERIRKQRGELTPDITIEEAKPAKAPLHCQFEWDDQKAGNEFRLMQARNLIRSVIEVEIVNKKTVPTQAYYHIRNEADKGESGRYEPRQVVVQSIDMFQSALAMLEQKLSSAVRAVQELKEAAGQSKHKGKMAIIAIVTKALQTAEAAIKKLAA